MLAVIAAPKPKPRPTLQAILTKKDISEPVLDNESSTKVIENSPAPKADKRSTPMRVSPLIQSFSKPLDKCSS